MPHHLSRFALCILLFIFFFCLSARTQDESGNNAGAQSKTYEVHGTVINSVTQEPIARALVTIAGQDSSAMLTDSDGHFSFAGITTGRHVLQVRRPGFFSPGMGRYEFKPITVGASTGDITLSLEPAGTITGQVTLSTSDSPDDIRVQLMRRDIQEGRARWDQAGSKTINSDGTFRFGNLQPGEYKLYIASSIDPDLGNSHAPVRLGFSSAWYPQEDDSGEASSLKIHPGQQISAQLMLSRTSFFSVTIPVANRSIQGLNFQVLDENGRITDMPVTYVARLQKLHSYLPAGNYTIMAQSYMPNYGFGSLPITVRDAPLQTQPLAVLPIQPIPVTIHKDFSSSSTGGPMIVGVENGKRFEFSRDINLMLFSLTGIQGIGGNLRHDPADPDPTSWMLDHVPPGRYWVMAYPNQGYVSSITVGGTNLASEPLSVGPGGASAPIEIYLENNTAILSVRIADGAAPARTPPQSYFMSGNSLEAPLGYLYLIPQFATASVIPQARPLQQTQTISGLQPGTYQVFALDRPLNIEYHNPQAREALAGKGQTITIEPNGTAHVDLDIISADTVSQ